MKNRAIIDTYKNLYDLDLIVANKYTKLEQLKKLYTYCNGDELDEDIFQGMATTSRCKERNTGRNIMLVVQSNIEPDKNRDKKLELVNLCSHEAVHVALDTFSYIGEKVNYDCQEPLAYLQAWAAECIYNTLTKV